MLLTQYTRKNCKKFYLSPYVRVRSVPAGLILNQPIFSEETFIKIPQRFHERLLKAMERGISCSEGLLLLFWYCRNPGIARKYWEEMIQKGVLE